MSAFAATTELDASSSPIALEKSAPAFDFGVSTDAAVGSLGGGIDFGIPDSAPWLDPAFDEALIEAARIEAAREKHPLELRFWDRIEEDLISLETWRIGLFDVVRHARGYPQIFPPKPVAKREMFIEYVESARGAWRRALDYFIGIDSILSRYGEFSVLVKPEEKRAAFAVAFAASVAQTRFIQEWAPYASRDETLLEIFNEEVESMGLPAGAWDRMKSKRLDFEGLRSSSYAYSHYRAIGGSAVLQSVLGRRRRIWAKERSKDLAAAPKAAKRRRNKNQSRDAMEAGLLAPVFRTEAQTVPFDEAVAAAEFVKKPLLPPVGRNPVVTISSQVIYGIETVRYWLDIDVKKGARPPVLMNSRDIAQAEARLLPGDILLARRERYLVAMGDGGYWQVAGLFVGKEKQRAKFFGGDSFNEIMRTRFPEGYQQHAESGGTVLIAGRNGVDFMTFERFASADRIAVLRTHLNPDALAEVVERGFSLAGRGFDPWEDKGSADRLGRAELIARAFKNTSGRFLPDEPSLGRRTVSVNGIAKRFDAAYGTQSAALDLILFLDANESRRNVRAATVEEFRSSWRRSKWTLAQEKD
ncbi:MAG: hypothetical protein COB53_05720 [Elusimicrobia bacterium]|nr:MAG: hypothetical protein COB53_05720 [Elusimicrobiota bacterium]